MERKSVTQRERIEKYYDTLLGQETGALSPDIVTYLLLVIAMMLLFIPVQELFVKGSSDRDLLFIVWTFTLFFTMSVSFYMMKYHAVSYGNNKTEAVSDMLLYMPLDRKENRRYLFGVMIRFLKKTTIAGLLMQLGVALIAYHSVSIWNIIYILVLTFITPLVICGAQIILRDIQVRK